jgi:hypothetical protein
VGGVGGWGGRERVCRMPQFRFFGGGAIFYIYRDDVGRQYGGPGSRRKGLYKTANILKSGTSEQTANPKYAVLSQVLLGRCLVSCAWCS